MNVTVNTDNLAAARAWLDTGTDRLCVDFGQGFIGSIPFKKIPKADFESSAGVTNIRVGQSGSVIILKHKDKVETWLPIDMFTPGGFTAVKSKARKTCSVLDSPKKSKAPISVRLSAHTPTRYSAKKK